MQCIQYAHAWELSKVVLTAKQLHSFNIMILAILVPLSLKPYLSKCVQIPQTYYSNFKVFFL